MTAINAVKQATGNTWVKILGVNFTFILYYSYIVGQIFALYLVLKRPANNDAYEK
jgi:hypothetical protein